MEIRRKRLSIYSRRNDEIDERVTQFVKLFNLGWSKSAIAYLFEMDHTTVIHHLRKIELPVRRPSILKDEIIYFVETKCSGNRELAREMFDELITWPTGSITTGMQGTIDTVRKIYIDMKSDEKVKRTMERQHRLTEDYEPVNKGKTYAEYIRESRQRSRNRATRVCGVCKGERAHSEFAAGDGTCNGCRFKRNAHLCAVYGTSHATRGIIPDQFKEKQRRGPLDIRRERGGLD